MLYVRRWFSLREARRVRIYVRFGGGTVSRERDARTKEVVLDGSCLYLLLRLYGVRKYGSFGAYFSNAMPATG